MRLAAIFIAFAFVSSGAAAAPPSVRVAIVSDANEKDLAVLVTTELSANTAVTLVERDDLAKAGDELKLQQLAGSDAVALGKLIGADGLLFIGKGPNGLQVRLTAVGLGYALFDDQIESSVDLSQEAKALAHRVEGYAPKLKLSPAQAIPISVLNLRADYATPDSTTLERKLTLLLESRLASLPEYVVLERRHGWSLGFEHSLSANPKPLLQGTYVVDGTLSFPMQSQGAGDVIIHLRLRSPNNQQTPLEIHGPINDLPRLVEQMTTEIQKATGTTAAAPPWQSQKEALEYLEEGIWAWQHNANDAALEALDSAELLGETAPDLVAARIGLLRRRAGQGMELQTNQENPLPSGSPSLDQRTDDTLEAIKEAARYSDENMEYKLQLLNPRQNMDVRAGEIKGKIAALASKLLVYLDQATSPRADELRQALRAITGYDPLHGKLGAGFFAHPYLLHDVYADEWANSLEEELAYYHLLYTVPNQFLPPWLVTGHGEKFCHRFLNNPEKEEKTFDQFVQALQNDPAGKLSYLLIMSSSPDDATADAAYKGYLEQLWNRRDDLVQEKGLRSEWYNAQFLPDNLRKRHATDAIPLLRYYLTHVNAFRYWEHSMETMWQPEGWSEADAAAVWTDYLAYKQRAEVSWKAHGSNEDALVAGLAKFEELFLKKFPQLATLKTPSTDSLVVRLLWDPWGLPGTPKTSFTIPGSDTINDSLYWVGVFNSEGLSAEIYKIHLPDMSIEHISVPELMNPQQIQVTPDALYLDYYSLVQPPPSIPHRMGRFDFKTQTWTVHTFSFPYERHYEIRDSMYLIMTGGGLSRYDWNTEKVTLLASSRRRPALNQFDDQEGLGISGVFSGPGDKPCVIAAGGTYYIHEQPGNWPDVFDSDQFTEAETFQDKTLIWSQDGEVVLLDPSHSEPEYLMTASQPHFRKIIPMTQKGVEEMTPWAGQTLWDAPERTFRSNGHDISDVSMHNDRLFVLEPPAGKTGSYELLVYTKGQGRKPCRIPLQFTLKDAPTPNASMDEKDEHSGTPSFNLKFLTTTQGFCFVSYSDGVWFLPFTEIDEYLKAHPAIQPSPAEATNRADSKKSTTGSGDVADPSNPNNFR
jgi:hypothetical protein